MSVRLAAVVADLEGCRALFIVLLISIPKVIRVKGYVDGLDCLRRIRSMQQVADRWVVTGGLRGGGCRHCW